MLESNSKNCDYHWRPASTIPLCGVLFELLSEELLRQPHNEKLHQDSVQTQSAINNSKFCTLLHVYNSYQFKTLIKSNNSVRKRHREPQEKMMKVMIDVHGPCNNLWQRTKVSGDYFLAMISHTAYRTKVKLSIKMNKKYSCLCAKYLWWN